VAIDYLLLIPLAVMLPSLLTILKKTPGVVDKCFVKHVWLNGLQEFVSCSLQKKSKVKILKKRKCC